jgi:uncharacterized protein YkwD
MRLILFWILLPIAFMISAVEFVLNANTLSAQATGNSTATEVKQTNDTKIAVAQANYLSQLEKDVIVEMNKVRANPQSYIPMMEEYKERFIGNRIQLPQRKFMMTKEGRAAVNEAIAFLKKQPSVSQLNPSKGISLAARDHVNDQGVAGSFGHQGTDRSDPFVRMERYGKWRVTGGENIAYGYTTAQDIVMQLIIDDGVPSRGHRVNMFNPDFRIAGVAYGSHKTYRVMCTIGYAGGFEEKAFITEL